MVSDSHGFGSAYPFCVCVCCILSCILSDTLPSKLDCHLIGHLLRSSMDPSENISKVKSKGMKRKTAETATLLDIQWFTRQQLCDEYNKLHYDGMGFNIKHTNTKFGCFASKDVFVDAYSDFTRNGHTAEIYEVLQRGCRLCFDIECVHSGDDVDYAEWYRSLERAIDDLLMTNGVKPETIRHKTLSNHSRFKLNSDMTTKRYMSSFHLVYSEIVFADVQTMKEFVHAKIKPSIISDVRWTWWKDEAKQTPARTSIDFCIYSKNRAMRCIGAHKGKPGDGYLRAWDTENWTAKLFEDADAYREYVEKSTIHAADTEDCEHLFKTTQPSPVQAIEELRVINETDRIIARKLIETYQPMSENFEYAKLDESGVLQYRRVQPSHCVICDQQHDSDGMYATIYSQRVYVRCHRDDEKRSICVGSTSPFAAKLQLATQTDRKFIEEALKLVTSDTLDDHNSWICLCRAVAGAFGQDDEGLRLITDATMAAVAWDPETTPAFISKIYKGAIGIKGIGSIIYELAKHEPVKMKKLAKAMRTKKPAVPDAAVRPITDLRPMAIGMIDERYLHELMESSDEDCPIATEKIISHMNHFVCIIRKSGGSPVIMEERTNGDGDQIFVMNCIRDCVLTYKKYTCSVWKCSPMDLWLRHVNSREFDRVVFSPDNTHSARDFNLFRGLKITPQTAVAGDVEPFVDHIRTIWCRGNEILLDYTLNWLAATIQFPGRVLCSSIVLKGGQGCGKGVICGNFMRKIFGDQCYLQATSLETISGRFCPENIKTNLFLFLDEVVFSGDRREANKLKAQISEPERRFEAKFTNPISVRNCSNIIIASNGTHIRAHIHTRTHACIHTYTHTRMQIHKHAHTCRRRPGPRRER